MTRRLQPLIAFPTWAITNAITMLLLRPTHPWYKKRFTLVSWHAFATDLCRNFDLLLWALTVQAGTMGITHAYPEYRPYGTFVVVACALCVVVLTYRIVRNCQQSLNK